MKLIDAEKECKKCGVCVDACPINEYDNSFILFKIFFKNELDFNIWTNCCSCFLCEENCPYNLSPRDEIFKKRRISKNVSDIPKRIQKYSKNLFKTGFLLDINDTINDIRQDLGLTKLNLKRIKNDIEKLFGN
ncbi:MAG: hypothetical protein ACTSPY_07105 [Candidatus Helarchaeota archaeon]